MQRIRRPAHANFAQRRSAGFTTPAVAIGMLVVMMGLALIIDRIWLETVKLELTSAAEAAALAAARELASDDSLLTNSAVDLRLNNARAMASSIAAQNFVCGTSVELNADPEGDIRFGNLTENDDGTHSFTEDETDPTSVLVTALRTRTNNNPVALFLNGVSGLPYGDVATRVEATIENDVVGLKAITGTPIPALPIAIWEVDPAGDRIDTWVASIESGPGTDKYSFDSETHEVVQEGDGIPELIVRTMMTGKDPQEANLQVLDIGTNFNNIEVVRQFKSGMTTDDLETLSGWICVGQGVTANFESSPQFDPSILIQLQDMIGHCRLCFLYSTATPQRELPLMTSTCTRVVAIRVMSVNGNTDGTFTMTIQPTVMTTRNAVLASENFAPTTDPSSGQPTSVNNNGWSNNVLSVIPVSASSSQPSAIPNRYVYKLRLTY